MKVMLDEGAYLPTRATTFDAGADLYTPKAFRVPAHGSATIDTGVHVQIPGGYFGKLESKSGLNVNHGVVSCGGVIDSGYTGSIRVKLYNFSDTDYQFQKGDKVVQLIIQPCELCGFERVDEIDMDTERGSRGFGSSGR